MKVDGIRVGVDGSRLRSGGGIAHLIGILSIDDPLRFGIKEIHVWAHKQLLGLLPDQPWLVKHRPAALEGALFQQLYWQGVHLVRELEATKCDILFSADVSTLCKFNPMVVLNHNMLAYDDGVLPLFGLSKDRIQQTLMYFVQKRAFHRADGVIFLTKHASRKVQQRVGRLKRTICIPHGVAEIFKCTSHQAEWPSAGQRAIRCLYVSPVHEYKHQPEVVLAVKMLRDKGFDLKLTLVGGGGTRALKILAQLLTEVDPAHAFVENLVFIQNDDVAKLIANADIFVFASSCETFGIALLEAMTIGLPIACSNRSSLPETLQDGGEYFDPQNPESISMAIDRLIQNADRRSAIAGRAKALALGYSWSQCAQDTWEFMVKTYFEVKFEGAA